MCSRQGSLNFSFIVGGDQVQKGKPDPEIFLTAASGLDAEPSRCVVFEDSLNGVIAASAAGTHVVLVPDLVMPTPVMLSLARHVLGSLEQAEPLLTELFS